MTREEFVTFLRSARLTADDQTALVGKELYPLWNEAAVYKKGDRVRYDGVLYRCLQDHTAQATWTPERAPSLWAKVLIPTPSVIPEWEQPESTNPYMKGDKVKYNGKTWVSSIDNNVWAPGVYGWDEVTE
mgnify:CR=1 FL=1